MKAAHEDVSETRSTQRTRRGETEESTTPCLFTFSFQVSGSSFAMTSAGHETWRAVTGRDNAASSHVTWPSGNGPEPATISIS